MNSSGRTQAGLSQNLRTVLLDRVRLKELSANRKQSKPASESVFSGQRSASIPPLSGLL